MFGTWTQSLETHRKQFQEAQPFQHCVIPNFLNEDLARSLSETFPTPSSAPELTWHFYNNPLERKYACNDFSFSNDRTKMISRVFDEALQSTELLDYLKQITGIENLETDPTLHGAGIHFYPHNGKLDIHLDYNIHPKLNKERRINIIYYLNEKWDPSWGGDLNFYSKDLDPAKIASVQPMWNTAAVFRTSDISYHGLPAPMRCPEGEGRKSLAIYYISPVRENATSRYKAEYVPSPGQPVKEELAKLYEIRKTRLIQPEDMWEGWEKDGNGYW